MYENGKMRMADGEIFTGMVGGGDKREWWRG
jgi:hypothetical protein